MLSLLLAISVVGGVEISLQNSDKLIFEDDRVQVVISEITEGQDRICLVNRAANATETTLDSDVMQSEVNGAPIEFIMDLFYTGDNKMITNSYSKAEIVTYQNERYTYSKAEIVTYQNERYSCIGYSSTANASSIIIDVLINEAGLHRIGVLDAEKPLILMAMQKRSLFYLDQGIGWLYFVLWSVSFYPQVIMNYRRFFLPPGHNELSSPIRCRFQF